MQGSGCRLQDSGCQIQGSESRPPNCAEGGEGVVLIVRRVVQGFGFGKAGQPHSGCRVQGAGFRVQGAGFRVQGAGFRVQGYIYIYMHINTYIYINI